MRKLEETEGVLGLFEQEEVVRALWLALRYKGLV